MDIEREKRLLAKYPFHIYLMVKAAERALDEGRFHVQDGMLLPCRQPESHSFSSSTEKALTSAGNDCSPSM